jgi:succinyl-diaminopimelate desuccinylase
MSIQTEIAQMALRHNLSLHWQWITSGEPFLTSSGALLDVSKKVICKQLGQDCELSTGGGTSDARFIAPYGIEVIELGLTNASIHQINECIQIQELHELYELYLKITQELLRPVPPH